MLNNIGMTYPNFKGKLFWRDNLISNEVINQGYTTEKLSDMQLSNFIFFNIE